MPITDEELLGGEDDPSVSDGLLDDSTEEEVVGEPEEVEAAPPEDEEPEATEDSPPDEDLSSYSKNVQARIQRERRLKAEAEDRYEAEREARERAEARASEAEKAALVSMLANTEREIKEKIEALKLVKAEFDTDKEIEISEEIAELRLKRRDIKAAKARAEQPKEKPARNPEADKWLRRNKWFASSEFSSEAEYARAIDRTLAAEGKLKIDTPAYFAEFDRRIQKSIPNLSAKIRKSYGGAPPSKSAPVARQAPSSKVTLTREDLQNMRGFGLDPANKTHLQEYAKNKGGANA